MSRKQIMVCSYSKCGKSLSEPIELSVAQADGSLETYYACPHCLSRVNDSGNPKKHLSKASIGTLKKALEETANSLETNKSVGCAHHFGYLKARPKDSPIPDECLLCTEVMKCM